MCMCWIQSHFCPWEKKQGLNEKPDDTDVKDSVGNVPNYKNHKDIQLYILRNKRIKKKTKLNNFSPIERACDYSLQKERLRATLCFRFVFREQIKNV